MNKRAVCFWLGFWVVVALGLNRCALGYNLTQPPNFSPQVIERLNILYDPWVEKGFCLSKSGPRNILDGDAMSSPIPICHKGEIVFHTHPVWAESGANIMDGIVWDEYRRRFGNYRFGVMSGPGKFKVYK